MYISSMVIMSVAEFRSHLSHALAQIDTEPVEIHRHGRRAAVLVSAQDYDRMLAASEDAEDVAAFDESMAEQGADIPWDQVRADLGWE
jgi:prevent-host-death family protein